MSIMISTLLSHTHCITQLSVVSTKFVFTISFVHLQGKYKYWHADYLKLLP
jgi:hypothetical protein